VVLGGAAAGGIAALALIRRRRVDGKRPRGEVAGADRHVPQADLQPTAELVGAWVHFVRSHVQESAAGLNNRLNAIALSAESLRRTRLSDDQREQVERIVREVQRATNITGALAHRVSSDAPETPPPAWHVLMDAATRPARLLLVEADESNRLVVARLLRSLGHHVTSVVNGREAWETLNGESFDCVLCDPRMPSLGGRALYEQVEERLPHVARRFVFVTGDYTAPAMHEFLERTGRPVVGKPYDLETLLQAIATILTEVGVVDESEK
jgi:CheY-like chemotaxis protein